MDKNEQPSQARLKRGSCIGVALMLVMVIGMIAWTVLVVAGYFHGHH
ncbi:MAG TPA: hypothetical protein VGK19_15460 [Capsulimonadaceae bacterium]|jgi:hypothetical protein